MKTKQSSTTFQNIDTAQLEAVLGGCGCGQASCNCANGRCGWAPPRVAR